MKASYCQQHAKYRIVIPPALTGTGKRQLRFFDTKPQAEAEIRRVQREGVTAPKVSDGEHAALLLAQKLGISEDQILDAVKHYQKTVLNVAKEATIEETALAYLEFQKREKANIRTIYKYRSTLRRLAIALNSATPMTEVTTEGLNKYLDSFGPGGTRRTQYANVKAFLNWSLQNGYLAVDPLANSKPRDKWGINKKPLGVQEFRRILFVIAGLEPAVAGGTPTDRFIRLLPFYVLGGLAGMRRCEIISSYVDDPVLQWEDINFGKAWIHVRDEVAKQTGADQRMRYIPLEPAAAAWLKRVARTSGPMMEISQSTLQRLNHELLDLLKLSVPENGLRNGYATWAATFRPQGELAKAMGDLESTVARYYVERREPETGRAWFAITPNMGRKIVPMVA